MTTTHSSTTEAAPGTAELWAVHVQGPDDVLACATKADAFRNAMWMNITMHPLNTQEGKWTPRSWAVPILWNEQAIGGAASHAEDLAAQEAEDPRWTVGQPLAAAADVLGPPSGYVGRDVYDQAVTETETLRKKLDDATTILAAAWPVWLSTIRQSWQALRPVLTAMGANVPEWEIQEKPAQACLSCKDTLDSPGCVPDENWASCHLTGEGCDAAAASPAGGESR